MIGVLHLEDKTATAAKDLSGGMKRKLCVGIALLADSKVFRQLLCSPLGKLAGRAIYFYISCLVICDRHCKVSISRFCSK